MRLEGKVCVITGAAGGIGAATASVFEREGARVVGVDLLEHSVGELSLQADVTDEESVAATYLRIRDELGRIDVLFNNAGISPPEDASVLDTELEVYERVQATNLRSVFLCCKHGIPHLLETGGGSVINTASFVAVMGAATSQIAYTASKGGVLALSRELGVEFAKRGVRVNALCPGPVETPLLLELFASRPGARPLGGSCTCRWVASARPRRSPTPCCSSPATSRASSTRRRSSSTAGSAAPTRRPCEPGLAARLGAKPEHRVSDRDAAAEATSGETPARAAGHIRRAIVVLTNN